jgi:hypothetical protein
MFSIPFFDKKLINFFIKLFYPNNPESPRLFNMQQSVVTFLPEFGGSLRIVSLPAGYTNNASVKSLVEDILQIGKTTAVNIQQRENGAVSYYTAFVEFEHWFESPVSKHLADSFQCEDGEMLSKAVVLDEPTFSWANGKKMFLSFKAISKSLKRVEQAEKIERPMYESDWKSIYIPLIPDNMFVSDNGAMHPFHPDNLTKVIQYELGIGEVSRIDFVMSEKGKSAYVHFNKWYDNSFVEDLRNELNTVGSKRIYRFNKFQFMCSPEFGNFRAAFLVFKINHTPIEEAPVDANVHQLAAANKYLDALVKEQAKEIAQLKALLNQQKNDAIDMGVDGKGAMTVSELLTEI